LVAYFAFLGMALTLELSSEYWIGDHDFLMVYLPFTASLWLILGSNCAIAVQLLRQPNRQSSTALLNAWGRHLMRIMIVLILSILALAIISCLALPFILWFLNSRNKKERLFLYDNYEKLLLEETPRPAPLIDFRWR
jgi:hypothetical protein